jgi:peptidoglycan/LPS O-acetylase OafA/YrhL
MSYTGTNALDCRLRHIDGLRGLAILLVLMTHTWAFNGAPALSFRIGIHTIVLAAIPAIGHIGVNLFLVLSGFCLAWPFMRDRSYKDRMSVTRFWSRRIRRIIPAYYISILLFVAIAVAFDRWIVAPAGSSGRPSVVLPSFADIWSHLIFIHNCFVDHVSAINGSYWSLALEFQLYLVFPIFLEAMFRWRPWRVVTIVIILQSLYRYYLEAALPASVLKEYEFVLPKAMFGRMLDFVCGMMAAYVVAENLRRYSFISRATWFSATSLVCLAAGFSLTCGRSAPQSLIDVSWSFGFASLICGASANGTICNRLFCYRPLVLLGMCSYSVYLLHQPLVECTAHLTLLLMKPGKAFLVGMTLLPIIVGVCVVFFWICERPFLNYFGRVKKVELTANLHQGPMMACVIGSKQGSIGV